MAQLIHQSAPIGATQRQQRAVGAQVATQTLQLRARPLRRQKIHAHVVELVRLIKHHRGCRRQQFGHARLAHLQVSKKQMVVDHHHISRHGSTARQVHMADTGLGAGPAQTVFPSRSDPGNDG